MNWTELLGMKYRLGSSPSQHGTADCFSLAREVIEGYGEVAPTPQRSWYRRLKRGDYAVFREELEKWGEQIEEPRMGAVALCQADSPNGVCLAAYCEEEPGWISFVGQTAAWSPIGDLPVEAIYCPMNGISANSLESAPRTTLTSLTCWDKPESEERESMS